LTIAKLWRIVDSEFQHVFGESAEQLEGGR